MFTLDKEGRFTLAEGKGIETLGLRAHGSEQGLTCTVHNDAPALVPGYQRALAGETFSATLKFGGVVFDASFSPLRDRGGAIVGVLGVATDVSARQRAENALRLADEKYRDLFENANDVIYTHDLNGRYTSINKKGAELLGYSTEEILGMNMSQVIAPGYFARTTDTMVRQLVGESPTGSATFTYESEITTRDGRRVPIEVNSRLICEGGKPVGVQGIARDISERKQAEAERLKLEEQLLQAQKMESIGRLAGGVAHDFNNLLTAIIGYAQVVARGLGENHPLIREVEEINEAGVRAASLTSQLLAFGRRQALVRRPIDLNVTIGDLVKMLRRIIGEDIELHYKPDSETCPVFADARQIEQVIMNLAVNARDAMPGGGKVVIEMRRVTLDEAYCRDHLIQQGSYVQIVVSDTGHGMDAATQVRAFEPFFTTKEKGKGTGLGLSVVYGIINQHDGWIRLYSEPGSGTTFRIFLPLHEEAFYEQKGTPVGEPPGGHETILLAEDEDLLRELARTVLEGLGYTVLVASDGEEAVQVYEANQARIQLTLLDMVMPRLGGRGASERIRSLSPDAAFVFMTGYSPEIVQSDFLPREEDTLLQKPYTVSDLAKQVRAALDNRES